MSLNFSPKRNYQDDGPRAARRRIAEETLAAIKHGTYTIDGNLSSASYDLSTKVADAKRRTRYYAPDSLLSQWSSAQPYPTKQPSPNTNIAFLEVSTLEGARYLSSNASGKIGILNFASAKKPGGGFLSGASAQEESIARSSTLYPTLMTTTAQKFYTLHNTDAKAGYYSHAMIYSPGVVLFRDDHGAWLEPLEVDVLTSPAVNAGTVQNTVRSRLAPEAEKARIEKVMKERMARILFLLEKEGVKNIILGSFGTGVFKNEVAVVARLWADLLGVQGSRFKNSFDNIIFAVLGQQTFVELESGFKLRLQEQATVHGHVKAAPSLSWTS